MSNREHRRERRIACEGSGKLSHNNIWHPFTVMDIGPGGGRLLISLTVWSHIREADPIAGWMEVEGIKIDFSGRIRWSALSRRDVQLGFQFLKVDPAQLQNAMDHLSTFELDVENFSLPTSQK